MRRYVALVLGVAFLIGLASTAFAWEFNMKGEFEYRYRYFSRTGDKDLYGLAHVQDSGGIFVGFAGPGFYQSGAERTFADSNAILAGRASNSIITRGGFSRYGSDARITDMRLVLHQPSR